jgi:TorA maturation chaperone TorD
MTEQTADTRELEQLALLHRLYSDPPDASLPLRLSRVASHDALWTTLTRCAQDLSAITAWSTEWTTLFEGPGRIPVPLFGSVYLDQGLLMGASTQEVRAVYAKYGLIPEGKIPADHLAYELGFCGFLTAQGRVDTLSERSNFAKRWMWSWVPAMTEALNAASQTPFFRELAPLTLTIVQRLLQDE